MCDPCESADEVVFMGIDEIQFMLQSTPARTHVHILTLQVKLLLTIGWIVRISIEL